MSSDASNSRRIVVVDSHTAGEPTRTVMSGGPELGGGTLAERRERFAREHDRFRSAIVNEPRGSDAMVGALLCEPTDPGCAAGVIFFNNVGCLGMCGHGTIGVIATLAHLGRIGPGRHRVETPVGVVSTELAADGSVAIENVPSYRHLKGVTVEAPGIGVVKGDVAWGGNWFFLISEHGQALELSGIARLTDYCNRVKEGLRRGGITGRDGGEIDHVELFGPAVMAGNDSRNFVLCPGGAYDRSPCGTGTSAKLACLVADGVLKPGDGRVWRQESIVGTVFEGWAKAGTGAEGADGAIRPVIRGRAFVNAEATLLLDDKDPFCWGIR